MENQTNNMEETVMSQNNFGSEMTITPASKQALKTMSGWMRFMAVLGFIGCAMMLLSGLIMMLSGSLLSGSNLPYDVPTKGMGFSYLVIAVLIFFPYLFLNRSCNAINNALMSGHNEELETGLINMKSYWKYLGIFTIIMLGLLVLMIPIMIGAGMAAMA
jgi:hypothetical protein